MAGICSIHQHFDPDCALCRRVNDQKITRNQVDKAVGLHTCGKCNFRYYKTVSSCPKCGKSR